MPFHMLYLLFEQIGKKANRKTENAGVVEDATWTRRSQLYKKDALRRRILPRPRRDKDDEDTHIYQGSWRKINTLFKTSYLFEHGVYIRTFDMAFHSATIIVSSFYGTGCPQCCFEGIEIHNYVYRLY